ncbi:MAG: CDP-glycerol glycerophosphotransferase family protein [Solirubrobacteraceae bacterium]
MARISVVVPVYNVEEYLRECLDSVAAQSFKDLEIVMVDDGSTDGSVAICEEYAARDERFTLVRQPNGGLGNARNTGARHATGEFLNFLDSDDVLPKHALRTLVRSLDKTGSDFATGNVHRFNRGGSSPAPFVAKAFGKSRPATHITKFRGLLVDRIAPNKLFRRSFWDQHGFAFPEGVTHEDIPVILPAHFLAKSVDVIAEPVYLYRLRETGGLSITQRRLEPKVLLDRLAAVSHVSQFLAKHKRRAKRWYDASVVAEDLRYYVNVLPHADDDYKALFLERVNAFLDTISPKAFEPLAAIERVKWALVRARRMDELLEMVRFQREELTDAVPVEIGGRFYGNYPFLQECEALGVPRGAYELRQELTLAAQLDSVSWEGDVAHLRGSAFITAIGAAEKDAQEIRIVALRMGRYRWWRRVRRKVPWLGIRIKTEAVQRPELTAAVRSRLVDVQWAGFHATVSAAQLERLRFGRSEEWELFADVHTGKISRRTVRFQNTSARPTRAADLIHDNGALLRVGPDWGRRLTVELLRRWAMVTGHRDEDGTIVLTGELHGYDGAAPKLELLREEGLPTLEYPVEVRDGAFTARIAPADLLGAEEDESGGDSDDENAEQGVRWQLNLLSGKRREKLWVAEDTPVAAWPVQGLEIGLHRSFNGHGALVARAPEPVATEAEWTADGALALRGRRGAFAGPMELVIRGPKSGVEHVFAAVDEPGGGWASELRPAAIDTLGGAVPLRAGAWHLCARPAGGGPVVPVVIARPLLRRLPLGTVVDHKPFALGAMPGGDRGLLVVERDLGDDELGVFHANRLLETVYRRPGALRDAVLYASFGGRQYSDAPRRIHEELVARGAPVEHLWAVHDGMARPAATATPVRTGSREHYDALATARWIVTNDHLPEFFERREGQTVIQTWHGTPLKRLGLDVASVAPTQRRFEGGSSEGVASWQHVLSPNAHTSEVLRRALEVGGEVHELGAPRNDVLAPEGREERAAAVRARLDLPAGKRVVLYAPTFRDHVIDRRGRPRLDNHLDIERLRAALGDEIVVLYRKHHLVLDPVPATADGFVRDVTSYPDATELLLAADVLVTDYSALLFDFALTGRPMILFAYDLETYRDEVRGFYLDPLTELPGPVVRTTEELIEALRAPAPGGTAYDAFAARFTGADDGRAAARAVDLLLSSTQD